MTKIDREKVDSINKKKESISMILLIGFFNQFEEEEFGTDTGEELDKETSNRDPEEYLEEEPDEGEDLGEELDDE